jgi:hypothetical protein
MSDRFTACYWELTTASFNGRLTTYSWQTVSLPSVTVRWVRQLVDMSQGRMENRKNMTPGIGGAGLAELLAGRRFASKPDAGTPGNRLEESLMDQRGSATSL